MAQYGVQQEDFHGHALYVLRDLEANCESSILPSVGNNCISYKIPKDDSLLELLYAPPDPDTLKGRASGYGTPILYPWPNRIDGGKFTFDGAEYQLETPAPGEHASHGYVHERPWRVVETGTSEGAWVTSIFTSTDFPEIGAHFPFPFEAQVTYRLKDGVLSLEFEGTNIGNSDMPVGLGIHPYFPLPLTENGNRDLCTVHMPASTYWPLRDDPIPTGEILPVDGTVFDVRENTPLKDRYYDNVWSGVSIADGWSRCEYTDPTEGVTIAMEANDAFRELVLYAPDTRPIICFEPYTCVTNAFNLQNEGIDAGLIRLQPDEKLTGIMKIIGEVL